MVLASAIAVGTMAPMFRPSATALDTTEPMDRPSAVALSGTSQQVAPSEAMQVATARTRLVAAVTMVDTPSVIWPADSRTAAMAAACAKPASVTDALVFSTLFCWRSARLSCTVTAAARMSMAASEMSEVDVSPDAAAAAMAKGAGAAAGVAAVVVVVPGRCIRQPSIWPTPSKVRMRTRSS